VENVVKNSLKSVFSGDTNYEPERVSTWTAQLIEHSLKGLQALGKSYKYLVTAIIMQKNGAGLQTAAGAFWDNAKDGTCKTSWENATMHVIVTGERPEGSLVQCLLLVRTRCSTCSLLSCTAAPLPLSSSCSVWPLHWPLPSDSHTSLSAQSQREEQLVVSVRRRGPCLASAQLKTSAIPPFCRPQAPGCFAMRRFDLNEPHYSVHTHCRERAALCSLLRELQLRVQQPAVAAEGRGSSRAAREPSGSQGLLQGLCDGVQQGLQAPAATQSSASAS
jgi:dynein light chain Tctex-type 1